jgi:hypothetical protein
MSELSLLMNAGKFPVAILKVNNPIYKGKPNPFHNTFILRGSVPEACVNKNYDTEQAACDAAVANGAYNVQGVDCRFMVKNGKKV